MYTAISLQELAKESGCVMFPQILKKESKAVGEIFGLSVEPTAADAFSCPSLSLRTTVPSFCRGGAEGCGVSQYYRPSMTSVDQPGSKNGFFTWLSEVGLNWPVWHCSRQDGCGCCPRKSFPEMRNHIHLAGSLWILKKLTWVKSSTVRGT